MNMDESGLGKDEEGQEKTVTERSEGPFVSRL